MTVAKGRPWGWASPPAPPPVPRAARPGRRDHARPPLGRGAGRGPCRPRQAPVHAGRPRRPARGGLKPTASGPRRIAPAAVTSLGMHPYAAERFTEDEEDVLRRYFT